VGNLWEPASGGGEGTGTVTSLVAQVTREMSTNSLFRVGADGLVPFTGRFGKVVDGRDGASEGEGLETTRGL